MTTRSTGTRRPTPAIEIPQIDVVPGRSDDAEPARDRLRPGELLGSVSGELGLRAFLEAAGHTLVVTSDKDGPDSVFERELPDADIVISQPFWPAYLTRERIAKARNLKLAITAGIGSDHYDLQAASEAGLTIAEITYSNSISVSEHVVMMILSLVRNYIPSYQWVVKGGWNIADCVERSYDLEGMAVGTVAAGRIGVGGAAAAQAVRCEAALHRPAPAARRESSASSGSRSMRRAAQMVPHCDVVTINAPLYPGTEGLFNDQLIATMKRGAYIVNTARGKICDRDAIARALESGQLAGYAGDVWFPQPAPARSPLADACRTTA